MWGSGRIKSFSNSQKSNTIFLHN
uniref:Uncharacterized protein n=1 Tax=Anguilla anguilla TaxID=7936 RepID=A0A0E9V027_ANGAN